MDASPVLVACAHGTRDERGRAAIDALIAAVASAPGAPDVVAAFVDVQRPTPEEVLAGLEGRPAVLVPLLLSTGYHVSVDLARAARGAATPSASEAIGAQVVVAPAMGPDAALVEVLVQRLAAVGVTGSGDEPVHLVAAGSSRERSAADVEATASALAAAIGRPVRPAYLSADAPLIGEVIAADRAAGRRTVAAAYLLAPGFFWDRLADSGAEVVTAPLVDPDQDPGQHVPPVLVDLVLRRFWHTQP